jgi:hypothetical protein
MQRIAEIQQSSSDSLLLVSICTPVDVSSREGLVLGDQAPLASILFDKFNVLRDLGDALDSEAGTGDSSRTGARRSSDLGVRHDRIAHDG